METTRAENYTQLLQHINVSAEKAIPKSKPSTNKNRTHISKPSWWDEACEKAVNKRKYAYKPYKDNPNLSNLLEL